MTDDAPTPPEPTARTDWTRHPRLPLAALVVGVLALGTAVAPYLAGQDFDGRVRAYLLANPQVLQEVSLALQNQENTNRITALNEAVAANPSVLAVTEGEPAFGPADAKVTVVQFFDYQCPYCKTVAPAYLALIQANPDVRFVFKELPILDRGDEITSQYAARAALAAQAQGRYLPVHEALMAEAALSVEAVDRILAANGVDPAAARAVIEGPQTSRILADVYAGAGSVGLNGTPTFFINGKVPASNSPEDLAAAIAAAKG